MLAGLLSRGICGNFVVFKEKGAAIEIKAGKSFWAFFLSI